MRNGKRILSVTVKRMFDESPDTSYMGKYSDRAETEYAIDRAADTFQGDIDNGLEWIDRIVSRLEDMRDTVSGEDPNYDAVWDGSIHEALNIVESMKDEEPFNVYWNRREYRYFNGPVENYKGETPENIRKYVRQDYERMESANRGDWCFIGIRADAKIGIPEAYRRVHPLDPGSMTVQTVTSGGLWGIESDSDDGHIQETEKEELSDLKNQLLALGFSKRAISAAFKNVEHKEE